MLCRKSNDVKFQFFSQTNCGDHDPRESQHHLIVKTSDTCRTHCFPVLSVFSEEFCKHALSRQNKADANLGFKVFWLSECDLSCDAAKTKNTRIKNAIAHIHDEPREIGELSWSLSMETLHSEQVFEICSAIIGEHQLAEKFERMLPIQFQGLCHV